MSEPTQQYEQMMSEAEAMSATVRLGIAAEDFAKSALGQFVAERAEQERAHALEQLAQADPFNAHTIAKLQNRVRAVEAAMRWLGEAIIAGRQAAERLAQLEQPD